MGTQTKSSLFIPSSEDRESIEWRIGLIASTKVVLITDLDFVIEREKFIRQFDFEERGK